MLDIDDSKGTAVVLIMIPKIIVKVWRTICLEILLQLMTTWLR